jgi:hypothetical protein
METKGERFPWWETIMRIWRLFGWCEFCAKWRILIFWNVEDGVSYDTYCWRCRRIVERED